MPIASDAIGLKVLVSSEGDAFTKGPRRVLLGQLRLLMEVDKESQKRVTIPARVVDPHRQEDIKHLQCKKTREK